MNARKILGKPIKIRDWKNYKTGNIAPTVNCRWYGNKLLFKDEEEAKAFMEWYNTPQNKERQESQGKGWKKVVRMYHCPSCGGYHVSTHDGDYHHEHEKRRAIVNKEKLKSDYTSLSDEDIERINSL